jgi:hypothetical protein
MNMHNDLVEERFRLNMGRINDLAKLIFSDIDPLRAAKPFQSEGARADILRTVVVFLHATFEDVLRTMARQRIAAAKSQVLDKIPLVGTSDSGRAEKFHLGALNEHRGKTVDQLIQESVENYLNRESFGSCGDVEEVLNQMGLDTTPFKPLYSDLDRMMKTRHRIVHEADLPSPKDSVSTPWTISDDFHLCLWNLVVLIFYAQLRVAVDPTDEVNRLFLARRLTAIKHLRAAREEIIALRDGPPESLILGFQKATVTLSEATSFLGPPSIEEVLVIWKKMKSPTDDTTEEQARAKFAVVCRQNWNTSYG